jgi:hypothetical protein
MSVIDDNKRTKRDIEQRKPPFLESASPLYFYWAIVHHKHFVDTVWRVGEPVDAEGVLVAERWFVAPSY